MGNLANKFLEAVNIISDAKTKSAGFDRSVQVTIKKLYQEDSTKYEVEYEGALKTATGAAGYKTNDVVWAVIPKNDLTQTLQIIGLASSIAADKQVLRSEDDEFEKVTANLATFTTEQKLDKDNISVVLWEYGGESNIISTSDDDLFKNAINSSLYFEINALFGSEIDIKQDINFGIRCYCNGVTDTPKFILDINDISGNPYYLIGERQKKIFSITTDETLGSFDKIEFFAEGLSANDWVTLKGFSFYGCRDVDYMTGLAANLLVSETGTDFREFGELSINNYNLATANNLILKANLRYDGILVPENELSKYTYKWYLRTLKNGLPVRAVIVNENKYTSTTADWTIDNIDGENARLVKYKGSDEVVYIPTKVKGHWKKQEYEEKTAFPAKGEANTLYYDKENEKYYIWQDNQYVEQTDKGASVEKFLNDKTYNITAIGDGKNSLFNFSNNIEAIVINTEATITEPDTENEEAEEPFSNLSDDVVIYGNIGTDHRKIPDGWFSSVTGVPNQLQISAAALFMPSSWIWCEVVDEKGNKVKTVEGWIDNADKSYDLQLVVSTPEPNKTTGVFSSTLTIQPISGSSLPDNLIYKWFKDGNEMVDKDGLPIRSSSITIFAEKHEYKCEVYTENNFLVFTETTNSIFIPDAPNTDKLSLSITGKSVYLCKADGEFIGQTENLKVWIYKEGRLIEDITDYKIEWSIPTENTMLARDENSSLDQQELKFNVQKYLLNSYINNVISVNVSYEQENLTASSSMEITFLKNGQPGTNGTDIVCVFEKTENGQTQVINYYQTEDLIPANTLSVKVFRPSTGESPVIGSISVIDMVAFAQATNEEEKEKAKLDLTVDIPISNPTCLKAICISEDGKSTWYAYLPIVEVHWGYKLIEPSSAPYIQFSSSGNIAEDMPKIFTCSTTLSTSNVEIDSKYLEVKVKNGQKTFTLQTKDNVVFKGDEMLPIISILKGALKIPILLLTNRFEYAAINGWDGTSIKLDEENDTILAPMAGFGKKEEDNSFTGVILGDIISDNLTLEEVDKLPSASDANFNIIYKDKSQGDNSYYVLRTKTDGERYFASSPPPDFQGIIGLNGGEQTFSLNANDGSAWFKGHIEATSGKIGTMEILSVPGAIASAQSTANTAQSVAQGAKDVADKATNTDSKDVTGGLYSWKFSPTDGLFMWKGAQDTVPLLKIDSSGLEISGKINATQGGNIGGFTIDPTAQTLISGNVGMSANASNWAFWAGNSDPNLAPFRVGHDGSIVAEKLKIESGQVKGLFTIETLMSTDVTAENLKVKHLQGADGSFTGTLSGASGTFDTLKTSGIGALHYTAISNGIYCGDQNSNSQTTGTVFQVNNSSQSQSIVGYWVQNTDDHKLPSKEVFLRGICVSGDDGGADTSEASGGVPHAYRGITRDWNVSSSAVLHIVSGIIVNIT